MEEKSKIEVAGLSESDSEIICKTGEAGTILYKHASCQATSDLSCEVIVPIMFCTMFSPICEASLQVDLPLMTSINVSISHPPAIPSLNIPSKSSKRLPQDQTVSGMKKRHCKSKSMKKLGMKFYQEDGAEVSPEGVYPDSQGIGCDSSPSPEEDCIDKDPDDSEFSSDIAFWKKVEKYTRQKVQASSAYEFPFKYASHTRDLKNKTTKSSTGSSQIASKDCENQQPVPSREGDTKLDEIISSVIEAGADDDWITDDEVDEEEQVNIDLAFKKEHIARRLPYNTKEKNFVCELCGKQYSKHSFLRKHIVRDHKEQEGAKLYPYFCQHCGNVYVKESQFLQHQKQFAGPCEVCGVILKCGGLFWSHKRDHNCVCQVCNRAFRKRAALDMHVKLSHREKTVPCPECDKMFPCESLKNQHIAKAHPGEHLPYKCDECDFHGKTAVAVKIHRKRIHSTNRKQYTCKECNSKFTCETSYNTHIENHISRSSIMCHLCSQRFTSDEDFQVHMKTIHKAPATRNTEENIVSSPMYSSGLKYACAVCNIILGGQEKLTQHMQQYHYMDIDTPRDIKVEMECVEAAEASRCKEQSVHNGDSNPQNCDGPIKNEPTSLKFSAGFDCSGGSALLMPASVVPPNVNMVDINGVQYHVIRGSQ